MTEHDDGLSRFRRALDDLSEGLRSLFGQDPTTPSLIEELLNGSDDSGAPAREPAQRARMKSVPPRSRRSGGSGRGSHLVVIK